MTDPAPTSLRPIDRRDLYQVAAVHLAAFQDSALSELGPEAVRRYYEWQLDGPHDSRSIAAIRDRDLVGFCFAGVFRGALSGFVRRNRGYLVRHVFTHPRLMLNGVVREAATQGARILGRTAFRRRAKAGGQPSSDPYFAILAIAVDPRTQGGGVGRILMDDAESAALEAGFDEMRLRVAPDNRQAVRFYEKLGWTRHVDDGGHWKGAMRKNLKA
jgi:ribosomal protein S18 acetylase RimI-like enzyme